MGVIARIELVARWKALHAVVNSFEGEVWRKCPECRHRNYGYPPDDIGSCACVCHWEWCDGCGGPHPRKAKAVVTVPAALRWTLKTIRKPAAYMLDATNRIDDWSRRVSFILWGRL